MRILICLLASGVCGCALIPEKKALQDMGLWPSRTERFCYGRGKFDRERRKIEVGIGCRW